MSLNLTNLNSFYVGSEPVSKIYAGSDLVWQSLPEYVPNPEITTFPEYKSYTTGNGRYLELGTGKLTEAVAPVIKNIGFNKYVNTLVLKFVSEELSPAEEVLLFSCEGLDVLTDVGSIYGDPAISNPYGYNLSVSAGSKNFHMLSNLSVLFGYAAHMSAMGTAYAHDITNYSFSISTHSNPFVYDILLGASPTKTYNTSMPKGLKIDLASSGFATQEYFILSDASMDLYPVSKPLMIPKT
jgi:hypothetical protein